MDVARLQGLLDAHEHRLIPEADEGNRVPVWLALTLLFAEGAPKGSPDGAPRMTHHPLWCRPRLRSEPRSGPARAQAHIR